jgi:amidase
MAKRDIHPDRQVGDRREIQNVTRRSFLSAAAAGSAAIAGVGTGFGLGAGWSDTAAHGVADAWLEQSISELQASMRWGRLTSRELTTGYLRRIHSLNPLLHAVIETNPDALAIATRRDVERRAGLVRGPLHGIPILVKDNIATDDAMQTTAGSLALVGSRVPRDARLVAKLRAAGAVILGKANLSEWANFRGFAPWDFNGWSARGGKTRDPYVLGFDPCGSSSGSAVAPAANLCAAAIGTETDGSIVCPAGNNLVFGLKPTLGLIAQDGIIPIGHSQDTAGPIARTVRDIAILLGVMRTPFGPVARRQLPDDYTRFLDPRSLRGKTIGFDERYLTAPYAFPVEPNTLEAFDVGLDALRALGANVVPCDTGDIFLYSGDEATVLLQEFKVDIARYLSGLRRTSMRTLADLIAFNSAHCAEEMPYFGQEVFELAEATSGDLDDPAYLAARANCLSLSRDQGIDRVLASGIDAIVAPSYTLASQPAAVAGYPNLAIPCGFTASGRPAGMWMYAGFLQEPKLLAFAYALEQYLQPRAQPTYAGTLQPFPSDPGFCTAPVAGASPTVAATRRIGPSFDSAAGRVRGTGGG